MIRRLLMAGCIGGLVAGLLLSVMQQLQVIPLIQTAENYEASALPMAQDDRLSPIESADREWIPHQGAERFLYTLAANLGMSVGFSLMLCAVFVFFEPKLVRHGMLWGLAGFAVFFLAPALKLPPELPGATSADLQSRQLWWLATVLCSAVGLFGVIFSKRATFKLLAAGLLILPQVIGGPVIPGYPSAMPDTLVRQFVMAVGAVNFIFWLALGSVTAWSFRLFQAHVDT